jgi:hypothetical protein
MAAESVYMPDRERTAIESYNETLTQRFPSPDLFKRVDLTQYPRVTWKDGSELSLPRLALLMQSDPPTDSTSWEDLLFDVDADSMNSFLKMIIPLLGSAGKKIDTAILDFIARWGDTQSLRKLGDFSRSQFQQGKTARVVEVLAALSRCRNSESALSEIEYFVIHATTPAVKEAAMKALSRQLKETSRSFREIHDRNVPSLGFDARGSKIIELGSQRLSARVLSDFSIELRNEKGKVIKSIPALRKGDSSVLRDEAAHWLAESRNELKQFASNQAVRLEEGMIADFDWPAPVWKSRYLDRPLLAHLARRILWTAKRNRLERGEVFRIAEDYTLADRHDNLFQLDETMRVSVAYPLGWDDRQRSDWRTILHDYAITPLFSQCDRPVFVPTDEEYGSAYVNRFFGVPIDHRSLKSRLKRFGWSLGRFRDAFPWCLFHFRDFLPNEETVLSQRMESLEAQTIRAICFHDKVLASTDYSQELSISLAHVAFTHASEIDLKDARTSLEKFQRGSTLLPISEVPPRVFSETIRDIARLTEHASG